MILLNRIRSIKDFCKSTFTIFSNYDHQISLLLLLFSFLTLALLQTGTNLAQKLIQVMLSFFFSVSVSCYTANDFHQNHIQPFFIIQSSTAPGRKLKPDDDTTSPLSITNNSPSTNNHPIFIQL